AIATAAVEHDGRVALRNRRLDVALDDALAEMARPGQPAALPLVLLADVDQVKRLAGLLHRPHLADAHLADAVPCGLDQAEEPRGMLHGAALASASSRVDPGSAPQQRGFAGGVRCARRKV